MRKTLLKIALCVAALLSASLTAGAQELLKGFLNRWEISVKNSAMPYTGAFDIYGEEDLGYFEMLKGRFYVLRDSTPFKERYYIFDKNPRMQAVELSGRLSRHISLSVTFGSQSFTLGYGAGSDIRHSGLKCSYIIPEMKIDWFSWKGASLYSSLGYGFAHKGETVSGDVVIDAESRWRVLEFTPAGLYYGYGNVFAFVEGGIGFHRPAFNYGVGIRF